MAAKKLKAGKGPEVTPADITEAFDRGEAVRSKFLRRCEADLDIDLEGFNAEVRWI